MHKLLAGLSVATLLMPLAANAATAEELTAQIQALLQQVQALQQQIGGSSAVTSTNGTITNPVTGGTVPIAGGVGVNSSTCPNIGRVLKMGTTGDDVARLQRFLAQDRAVYPEAMVSGYYGALTQAAVQRWQVKYNIVSSGTPASTGYGVVGPRTAAAIALLCSTGAAGGSAGDNVGGFIQVTPTTGLSPLTVTIVATTNTTKSCTGATYEIYYGDTQPASQIVVPQGRCSELQQTLTHVYTTPGTYTITLRAGTHQTSATVVVLAGSQTGGSQGGGPFSVSAGVSGNPFAVTAVFDIASNCARYDLDWGDNSAHVSQAEGSCASGSVSINATHTYANGGTYTITLKRGASLGTTDTASVVIVR